MIQFSIKPTKYEVRFTSAMKKDFKKAFKRGYDLQEFACVVEKGRGWSGSGMAEQSGFCVAKMPGIFNWRTE